MKGIDRVNGKSKVNGKERARAAKSDVVVILWECSMLISNLDSASEGRICIIVVIVIQMQDG